jgi:hypothetical protein
MLTRYQNKVELSSYRVNKDVILNIEDYCHTRLPKQMSITPPMVNETAIILHSSQPRTYNTINQYKSGSHSEDISAVTINYSLYNNIRGVVVSIHFDKTANNSWLQTCVYDDRGVTVLPQIQEDILKIINNYKSVHRFTYSPESALVPFLVLAMILCFFGILLGNTQLKTISIIVLIADVIYLVAFRNVKGSTFHLRTT